ncbi:maleylacetoacetate isomerase [Halomonas campaniensis]|uniref:Maleylacetoacetate isomerase n=1 Tax=Halomonas campaniensis TaxID=213554 RepID=A0A246S4L5_9GAMM|nr:maleylacetoacetate isomerase [Halomonas campaniensis]OWV31170.1 maleylacetoacetate isomerase [Halomonas campaniensis]
MTALYGYFRSSAAYRVRIALNLKSLEYHQVAVNLIKGEQHGETNRLRNSQGLVPSLVTDEGVTLNQSLAICEYLDERYPTPSLLPNDAEGRARVRALSQLIACEIHPLNNLRVLKYLVDELGSSEDAKLKWYRQWVTEGFSALETMLSREAATGKFCYGNTPTLADICLVPQVYNAERFECELSAYPEIQRITERCRAISAFQQASPDEQPDFV